MKEFRVDEKGKFYTTHVSKRAVRAVAATPTSIVQGMMHLMLDNRLKDEMNNAERFVAMTDVHVLALDGKTQLYSADALMLNKDQIVWVISQEDQRDVNKT